MYLTSTTQDGFVLPDVADSLRDLRGALKGKKKTLRLVGDAAAADVIVTVEDRAREVVGVKTRGVRWPWGGDAATKPATVKTVYATLIVGRYELPLQGTDDMFWELAADDLAGQIDRWIKANRERLAATSSRVGVD